MMPRFLFSLVLLLIFSLTACDPTKPEGVKPDSSAEIAAMSAEQSGDFLAAAAQYALIAEVAIEPQRSQFYLRAATAYWLAYQADKSDEMIILIDRNSLNSVHKLDLAVLEADIALYRNQPQQAIILLASFDLALAADTQKKRVFEIRAEAYDLLDTQAERAISLIQLSELLAPGKKAQNQDAIWQSLMTLDVQALDLFNSPSSPAIDSGWFALAYIVKSYQRNLDAFMVALEDWMRNYPNHPADKRLYTSSLESASSLPEAINNIAVLLPETGPYKSAAEAIKQGIIAAYLINNSNVKLHFFPVDTNHRTGVTNVWQQYQQAVSKNVDIVIGPLSKQSIKVLTEDNNLTVPVLALNRVDESYQKKNLFQFGLAPEDDAVSIANYAMQQGFKRAVVLSPNTAWGQRVVSAFEQQWTENEGVVLKSIQYDEEKSDFADVIKPLLSLNESEKRAQMLKRTTGTKLEFDPRRRQDIDFIFLVAKPLKARQLAPQFKFHRSGRLTIIATSHVYGGKEDSRQDIDLNGVVITDIPWVFKDTALNDPSYIALHNSQQKQLARSIRLYALGADAYRVVDKINDLSRDEEAFYPAATGDLSINQMGQIHRRTPWGVFKEGQLKPLLVSKP